MINIFTNLTIIMICVNKYLIHSLREWYDSALYYQVCIVRNKLWSFRPPTAQPVGGAAVDEKRKTLREVSEGFSVSGPIIIYIFASLDIHSYWSEGALSILDESFPLSSKKTSPVWAGC